MLIPIHIPLRAVHRAIGCLVVGAGLAAGLAGCDTATPSLSGATLSGGTVGIAYSAYLGGAQLESPTWTVTSGNLPPGLTLGQGGAQGGVISGTPTTAGSYSFGVTITNSGPNGPQPGPAAQFTLVIAAPPPQGVALATTTPLPSGAPNAPYTFQFTATGGGGAGTYTWSWTALPSGPALPAGLTLSPAGVLSGTPTQTGNFVFWVKVASTAINGAPDTAGATFALSIQVGGAPLTITSPASLPEGFTTVAYSQQLTATGGTGGGYQWAIAHGALPAGLSLSPSGVISGTPTAAGTVTFKAQVTSGTIAVQLFTLVIGSPLAIATPMTLPLAVSGVSYSVQLVATGGVGNYSWSIIGGALPPGINLSASGLLTGSAPTDGTQAPGSFTAQVTSGSETSTAVFTLAESSLPFEFVSQSPLPAGTVNTPYNFQFVATPGGGYPAIHYTIVGGTLPTGLTLTDGGLLSGTPTVGVIADPLTVRAKSGVDSITSVFLLTVTGGTPEVVITSPATLPAATIDFAYSVQLTATGGPTPTNYAWSVTPGSTLPSWLQLTRGGQLSGMPVPGVSTPESFSLTVANTNFTASQTFTLTVLPVTITITTPSPLPTASVGVPYSVQLAASGGPTGTYFYSVAAGSVLPSWMNLTTGGLLTGTPTSPTTTPASFAITAAEGTFTGEQTFTIQVAGSGPCAISPTTLPAGTVGTPYGPVALTASSACTADGASNPGYWLWGINTLTAPPGLGLATATQSGSVTETFQGTPSAPGTYTFTISFTGYDGTEGSSVQQSFTVVINDSGGNARVRPPAPSGRSP